MTQSKYIVFDEQNMLIFSPSMSHVDVAAQFGGNPTSAGFITIGINKDGEPKATCYGSSMTLGIGADPENDNRLVKFTLGLWD